MEPQVCHVTTAAQQVQVGPSIDRFKLKEHHCIWRLQLHKYMSHVIHIFAEYFLMHAAQVCVFSTQISRRTSSQINQKVCTSLEGWVLILNI